MFEFPDDLRELYMSFGINLPDYQDGEAWELPVPTRLLVRKGGSIAQVDADPDYRVRPEPTDTLGALRAL